MGDDEVPGVTSDAPRIIRLVGARQLLMTVSAVKGKAAVRLGNHDHQFAAFGAYPAQMRNTEIIVYPIAPHPQHDRRQAQQKRYCGGDRGDAAAKHAGILTDQATMK